jgi:hypothetical protein
MMYFGKAPELYVKCCGCFKYLKSGFYPQKPLVFCYWEAFKRWTHLDSETYVEVHVESLRTGIYRSDLPVRFEIDPMALDDLDSSPDETLKFATTEEAKRSLDETVHFDELRQEIMAVNEKPLIYHVVVSAMYPNIILTNRLPPPAIVTPDQCAVSDLNGSSDCQRLMKQSWRGEVFPASRGEAERIHLRTVQDERKDTRRAVADGQAIPRVDVMSSRGSRSQYDKAPC